MIAEEIKIECEENGFHLCVDGETWLIADPEALYDHVKATIGPWLRERDEAFAEFRQAVKNGTGPAAEYFACKDPEGDWIADQREAYALDDPKHPTYHERMSEIADNRDAFTVWQDEDR